MASIPEMMCQFIGVDASCQSNIRGMGNRQWIWWGNPHAYISADKGAVTTSPRPSSGFIYVSRAFAWNSPSSLLTRKPFMLLVFHAAATPASLLLLQLLPSHSQHTPFLCLTMKTLHRSSWRFNYFIHGHLNNLFTSSFQSFSWSLGATKSPLLNYTLPCP